MNVITDLGDLAVILPLAALVAAASFAAGWHRGAAAWCIVFPSLCLAMLLLKILTFSHLGLFGQVGLRSPSGHTAVSILAYGGLFALSTRLSPGRILLIGAGVGAIIGATRVALGYHTIPDVLVGGGVGLLGLVALTRIAGACPPAARNVPRLVLLLLAVGAYTMIGMHLAAEGYIRRLSM